MRKIKNDIYEINKYIIYKIYLFNEKNKNKRIIIIKITSREIYLIDKLVVDILLENNILILKEINLLFLKKIAYINNYNINIFIEVYLNKSLIRRIINSKKVLIVLSHLNVIIIIYYLNLFDRDFLFKSRENSILFLYIKLINKNIKAILIKNDLNKLIKI